jgi:hypothetical protein
MTAQAKFPGKQRIRNFPLHFNGLPQDCCAKSLPGDLPPANRDERTAK